MYRINTYDPLADVFPRFLRNTVVAPSQIQRGAQPVRIDVVENQDSYQVHADMPGFSKSDIHVEIDGSSVVISAESKAADESKDGERVLRTERYRGAVSRSFSLASELDEEGAIAKFENGVLDLVLPKKAASSRKLTIN